MDKRIIRKPLVVTQDEEFQIDKYLARKNHLRRLEKQRRYSFNSFALDAIMEKIARERKEVPA